MALSLSACEGLPFDIPWISDGFSTVTPQPGETGEITPSPDVSTPTEEPTPEPITNLTIWVPPEMDPLLETPANRLFSARLDEFSELNDGLAINVRVKAVSGVGGLLDSLTATSAAAPDALPDLIMLTRSDLENAALKGLIYPVDGLTTVPDETDLYSFTREMSLLQGSTFGLPFAADSLALVYRPEAIPEFPSSWQGLLESESVLHFAAESDQALFQLALYQAAGGAVQDNQRRPELAFDPLTRVLRYIRDGVDAGTFLEGLDQYQGMSQVWTAFRDNQADLAVTWTSNYLQEGPADTAMVPLFPFSDNAVSLGTGMSWALAAPEEHRHAIAVALAEFLVESEYLSEWTEAAGYLPPRPSSLEGWEDQNLRTTVSQIALMTRLQPSNDILSSLGPILRDATRQILQDLADPAQAAQVAVESLED